MKHSSLISRLLAGASCAAALSGAAMAASFDIPRGDLAAALDAYSAQSGVAVIVSTGAARAVHTQGLKGDYSAPDALSRILRGTGFVANPSPSGVIEIVGSGARSSSIDLPAMQLAQAAPVKASVETVTVTSSKLGGADVQSIPIAITAMNQEQLTATQTAGGPDLVKQVPNLTFTKTNFAGYSIQIRGIGTQAVSVTTDPAVAVALNDIPFIRNHFFEQEFYDVGQVEVARGPQGTLYGRNATAGVVNLISAKPTDQFEGMLSADWGNYKNRRYEGMINLPIVDDRLDLRVAGEWTKRDGYSFDEQTGTPVDGRDLWSSRVTMGWKPIEKLQTYLVWEHFSEHDDRLRSGKQLCTRDNGPGVVDGPAGPQDPSASISGAFLSQGCLPGSLYSPSAFGTPAATANPFIAGLEIESGYISFGTDPYAGVIQSQDLRVIDSLLTPTYRAKNDTVEFNANYDLSSALTVVSQTGYSTDFLYSTEDYDRFNTAPGLFVDVPGEGGLIGQDGEFCDPQLGCSSRLVGEDVSQEHAEQFSQEVRLTSNYAGPLNFSVGGNFLHYQTVEDYYVFYNGINLLAEYFNLGDSSSSGFGPDVPHAAFNAAAANSCVLYPSTYPPNLSGSFVGIGCSYVDPNPLAQIDGKGHDYFRSDNPYRLSSWAGFGEVYYQVAPGLKLTGGLRWTDDKKHFTDIPSWTLVKGKGYPVAGFVDQQWKEWTGRFNASWTPKLDFTDQSLFYASYSRGYKGGGANPPGVVPIITNTGVNADSPSNATHPVTFEPEFVHAFELGTKNTLFDGGLTFDADVFYYKYNNYQISQIVDRTAVNSNFDANVKGAELESTWEPVPGLKFSFKGGYEATRLADGSKAIDLMDRTAGQPGWMVVKPFITQTSNCILPTYVVNELLANGNVAAGCLMAYSFGNDPVTQSAYTVNPDPFDFPSYVGFNPATAPNSGQGFYKDISGNELPNAPHFTTSLSADYTLPVSEAWALTLHSDFYWQADSFARVFNDEPYDKLHGYTNVNLALILTGADGWQAMGYLKNVFNTAAITGDFLNSDDSGLTTNVFLTDPRLFGVRITKNF